MQTCRPLYEGKAKKLFQSNDPQQLVLEYKDTFTAFNAQKKSSEEGKGTLNNLISTNLFERLSRTGIKTHFIQMLDNKRQLVKKTRIVPLEVVLRNMTAGSLCKRLGVPEGMKLDPALVEFYLKDDSLGDPIVTEDQAVAFGWTSREEIEEMKSITRRVNDILCDIFALKNIRLIDFKLEFGRTDEGELVVADEISPDTCRFQDASSGDSLDKDRFRKDMGNVLGAYREIWRRLSGEGDES
ncbi:MAG: phosphoribosylaminoimidazolesuccinocarboxamide synthase [Thermovirgaceae bacterium]